MAKALPGGNFTSPWKRLPSGVFVPGNMGLPSGTTIIALQDLIRQVYLAANQKPMTVVCSAESVELIGGNVSQQYNLCTNRLNYFQNTAANRPTYIANDPTFGGKPSIVGTSTRFLTNNTNPPNPSVTKWYQKSVVVLDAWPPGGKAWYGSTANRFGVYTSSPDAIRLLNAAVVTSIIDQPQGRPGVLTWRLGNSVADFVQFGAALNLATGVNAGNTDPASLGKFNLSAGGLQGITGRETIQFAWTVDLTTAESNAIDDLLNTYFGGGLLIYSSTGHIKSAGIAWLGSSQTFYTQGAGVNYQGARYRFYTNYFTGANYPIWTTGHTSSGTWPQPANDGISGQGIDVDGSGVNPGTGLAQATLYLNPANIPPAGTGTGNPGAGLYAFINLELGGADCAAGAYVPGTTANNLLAIANAIVGWNPRATVGINTICPQLGNPASVAALSLEISGIGGIWDQYDAAHPTNVCARVDLNRCINGGIYDASLFVDSVHLNQTGQFLWGDEIDTKTAAAMSAKTLY